MNLANIIVLGVVVWLITKIVTESDILDGLRWRLAGTFATSWGRVTQRLAYLIDCNLCSGVWIGFVVAAIEPGPFDNIILDGLVYKAVAHCVLSLEHYLDSDRSIHVNVNVSSPWDDDDDPWDEPDEIEPDPPHLTIVEPLRTTLGGAA